MPQPLEVFWPNPWYIFVANRFPLSFRSSNKGATRWQRRQKRRKPRRRSNSRFRVAKSIATCEFGGWTRPAAICLCAIPASTLAENTIGIEGGLVAAGVVTPPLGLPAQPGNGAERSRAQLVARLLLPDDVPRAEANLLLRLAHQRAECFLSPVSRPRT